MSNDFEGFACMFDVSIPWAVLLSVSNVVPCLGCGWPILMHAVRIGYPCLAPRYIPLVLALYAEVTKFLIVLHRTSTRLLSLVVVYPA